MSGYFKFAVLAFLMLTASGATGAFGKGIMTQELLEAEIRALAAIKEVEAKARSIGYSDHECSAADNICPPLFPEFCCSGKCAPHPIKKIYVCA